MPYTNTTRVLFRFSDVVLDYNLCLPVTLPHSGGGGEIVWIVNGKICDSNNTRRIPPADRCEVVCRTTGEMQHHCNTRRDDGTCGASPDES